MKRSRCAHVTAFGAKCGEYPLAYLVLSDERRIPVCWKHLQFLSGAYRESLVRVETLLMEQGTRR